MARGVPLRVPLLLLLTACESVSSDPIPQSPPPIPFEITATWQGPQVVVQVTDAAPNETIWLAGSLAGPGVGPCPPVLQGLCLDLLRPARIAIGRTDAAGRVTFTVTPPAGAQPWVQGVAPRPNNPAKSPPAEVLDPVVVRTVADLLPGDLVITELFVNPSGNAEGPLEWAEVYNPGETAIDLLGLELADLGTDRFTVPSSLIVEPGAYVVLGGSVDPVANGGAPVALAWTGIQLGNGDDELILRAAGVDVDAVAWDDGLTFPDPSGRSISLSDGLDAATNDDGAAWCEAVSTFGTLGDFGTPGAPNPACAGGPVGGPDADNDGSPDVLDCDDLDPSVRPGAVERCDGVDNDCNGQLPAAEHDGNGDGLPDCDPCADTDYRLGTQGLNGPALQSALSALTVDSTCSSYTLNRAWMFTVLDNDQGLATCVYTGATADVSQGEPDPTVMNTEHTWPQSLGAGNVPARCDLHHLFPSDATANSERGSLPFRDVVSNVAWSAGGSRRGRDASGAAAFEPRADHKGNVARAMLYVSLRHNLPLAPGDLAVYRAWHQQDPVDADELHRTFRIGDRQGAANPFITCPDLVGRL